MKSSLLVLVALSATHDPMPSHQPHGAPVISESGSTVISGRFIGPFIRMRSSIDFKGNSTIDDRGVVYRECDKSITLAMHLEQGLDTSSACSIMQRAAGYVASEFSRDVPDYEIHLIPQGAKFHLEASRLSWRNPKIVLAAPWFDDPGKRPGNIADLVAHESFHVIGAMARSRKSSDEYFAYYVGLCGQLHARDSITTSAAPGFAIDGTGVEERSSSAAQQVRAEIQEYFQDGVIPRDSEGGRMILAKCAEAFSPGS